MMFSFWTSAKPDESSHNVTKFEDKVTFKINGEKYTVDANVPANTSLNTFIRDHSHLRGTKNMCLEGGCGACIVSVTCKHPVTAVKQTYAVNSCLFPVFSCHGLAITTIEGIGNKKDGYNIIQKTLAHFNGSQCGYCSPGMVMNMYSLSEGKDKNLTMKEVENSFGGNICRCTGYRPILDAFKSLCVDAPPELKKKCSDIEDIYKLKTCPKNGKPCQISCEGENTFEEIENITPVYIALPGSYWFRVTTPKDVFEVLNKAGDVSYMFVCGNTAHGVYRRKVEPKIYIDITGIKELRAITTEPTLVLGGSVSLTEAMELFYDLSKMTQYAYTKVLADHIDLIANVPVRNAGTIAGNLSIKHQYNEFPSDMFLMLETVGATLNILQKDGKTINVTLLQYLKLDMNQKIIISISLPKLDSTYAVKTFKIMPRAQNAHAYVNAGFLMKLSEDGTGKVVQKPNIVFGGIDPQFLHAIDTEKFLIGKSVLDEQVLQDALSTLDSELLPDYISPDAVPEYRKGLAKALFYKFILSLAKAKAKKSLISGGDLLTRPLSSAKQTYETDKSVWPLNQPVPKLEALAQCSGEAAYVNDHPAIPGELFGAFVVTTIGRGNVSNIDPKEALGIPGVVRFLTAEDIPGKNSFTPPLVFLFEQEEIFCSGKVLFAGQPVGLIVAETQQVANMAAQKVKLEYTNVKKPVILLREAAKSKDPNIVQLEKELKPKVVKGSEDVKYVIKGSFDLGSQYHYTMETQTCLCVPIEDGMDVYPATQWMDLVQVAISEALNIPENRININVRRLGGAYGAKISRSCQIATACAVAAHTLNKPVRIVMKLETNMESLGKRNDVATDYEVGVDDDGKIQYLKADFYENNGSSMNEPLVESSIEHLHSCYDSSTWSVMGKGVRTDLPSMTYCRAPGSTEGIGFIENVMEHIAKVVNKDPIEVRLKNMPEETNPMAEMINDIKKSSNYEERKKYIENFNKLNRWKKRGMTLVPMTYPFPFWGNFSAIVSIYAKDGSVSVAHGGIECGQGINTKVAQVSAHILGIPLEMVSIKPSNTLTAPNGMVTGGSIASEACCYAAMMCCRELLKRMEPYKKDPKEQTWAQLVQASSGNLVELCATYMFTPKDEVKPYNIWGVTVTEVEVDILTGQYQVLRVDIIEDAGKSLSPEVDIGQVEGAFVMGLGYWLQEQLVYNEDTGELLTNRTWNYKPPGVKDIPIDFRIELRRNAPNPTGVLRSKATGEPPLCMSCSALFALKNALYSARQDAGAEDKWFQMNGPATVESVFLNSLTKSEQFVF